MYDKEIKEILDKLTIFENMYEQIRLVDPTIKKVINSNNNNIDELDFKCFDFWNKRKVCDNCISIRAFNENKTFVKVEHNLNKIYIVTAVPIELSSRRVVIELLLDTTNSMIIENGKNDKNIDVYKMIDSFNNLALKDSPRIFVLDNIKSVRARLHSLLATDELDVIESSNSSEFFDEFLQKKCNGNLIIMDIELSGDDGFQVIRKIRNKNKTIPIIILTANNNREILIKAIFEGAQDYILKPFQDIRIKGKVNEALDLYANKNRTDNNITLDLPSLLRSEFAKSKKGKFSISVMMVTFLKPTNISYDQVEYDDRTLSDIVYDKLEKIVSETDLVVKYGTESFIGLFPFASKINDKMMCSKIKQSFDNLKQNNKIFNECVFTITFITYPEDVTGVDDAIKKLIDKTKHN